MKYEKSFWYRPDCYRYSTFTCIFHHIRGPGKIQWTTHYSKGDIIPVYVCVDHGDGGGSQCYQDDPCTCNVNVWKGYVYQREVDKLGWRHNIHRLRIDSPPKGPLTNGNGGKRFHAIVSSCWRIGNGNLGREEGWEKREQVKVHKESNSYLLIMHVDTHSPVAFTVV